VTATFSETMNPASITSGSVTLSKRVGVVAIAAGWRHTVALKDDGTVAAWGDNASGQTAVPAGLSDVVAIAAGESHTVALKGDGTVVAWGAMAAVPAGLSGVVAVAAGTYHTVALKGDGTVVAWGNNSSGQTTVQIITTARRRCRRGCPVWWPLPQFGITQWPSKMTAP
jgi:alpha-tubulin suppressor-like RCC1 family protein